MNVFLITGGVAWLFLVAVLAGWLVARWPVAAVMLAVLTQVAVLELWLRAGVLP